MHVFSLIQCINQCLLYLFIYFCIQCVYTDNLIENLFILLSDLRHRIGNDRKAALFSFDIPVHHLALTAVILQDHLFLTLRKLCHSLFCHRFEWFFTKHVNACRSCKPGCLFLIMFICCLHHFQFALQVLLIHEDCLIIFMIVFILLICHCSAVSDLVMLSLCQHTDRCTIDDRF